MFFPERTTAVPNAVFDEWLPELKGAELKILLVIIRQTLGWEDRQNNNGRKTQDWISSSQMRAKTGCSGRAITSAIESLVQKRLISVFDQWGCLLDSPKTRKGKSKLFFALTPNCNKSAGDRSAIFSNVDCKGKSGGEACFSRNTSAEFTEEFSKNCAQLAQKMRITK